MTQRHKAHNTRHRRRRVRTSLWQRPRHAQLMRDSWAEQCESTHHGERTRATLHITEGGTAHRRAMWWSTTCLIRGHVAGPRGRLRGALAARASERGEHRLALLLLLEDDAQGNAEDEHEHDRDDDDGHRPAGHRLLVVALLRLDLDRRRRRGRRR